ncbi:hypothetical protein WCS_00354 [Escherichia coli KTE14]|nr:hypothetical protein WCS_00354 [Escherichia coli KTE14]MBO9081743.1 hypothetical protein [Escherichia coli]
MKSMDKLTTGVAYGTSAGSAGYWFLQLLDKVTPSLRIFMKGDHSITSIEIG